MSCNLPIYIKRESQFVGIGTALPTAKLHVQGDIVLTGQMFNADGEPFSLSGGGGTWEARTSNLPELVAPVAEGGTITVLSNVCLQKYGGNDNNYSIYTKALVVSPPANRDVDYKISLPDQLKAGVYATDTVIGEFWLRATSNSGSGVESDSVTYKAVASVIQGVHDRANVRFLSGTTAVSLGHFAAGNELELNGFMSYATNVTANLTASPSYFIPGASVQWADAGYPHPRVYGGGGGGGGAGDFVINDRTGKVKYVGDDIAFKVDVEGTVAGISGAAGVDDYYLDLPYPVHPSESNAVVGDFLMRVTHSGTMATYRAYAKVVAHTNQAVKLRWVNGTHDVSFYNLEVGSVVDLQGLVSYKTTVSASIAIPYDYIPNSLVQNSNGNIGIGTSLTPAKLTVGGDIYFTGGLYQNGEPFVSGGGNTGAQWNNTGNNLFVTGSNVGIGVTNPTSTFHVVGDSSFTGGLFPTSCNVFDLGSSNLRWKDLYLSGNTIDIGGTKITRDETTGNLNFTPQGVSNTYAKYISTATNLILPSSVGTFNGVNVTALNKRTRTSYAAAKECVSTWTTRTSAADSEWNSVCWAPELSLFCAVASTAPATGDRVMTSPDGIVWTVRESPEYKNWTSVCWAPELSLFCAVANYSTDDARVMTSPNGISWTAHTSPSYNDWACVCWSSELSLFCAVAYGASGNERVMTSPDGINWTLREGGPIYHMWRSVCWSPELSLFCAVADIDIMAYEFTSDYVMTSPDGIHWTTRASAADKSWQSVCWAPELSLFCAVAFDGIMTSPDGITWTARASPAENGWHSVCWAPEVSLFCAVAFGYGTGNLVMTSPDGIHWTTRASAADIGWYSVCWAPELSLFCAVATGYSSGNRVMTSGIGMPNAKSVVKALPSQMMVDAEGNVGIGTTNPQSKLVVAGNILATGSITASNMSIIGDFVTLNTVTSNTEQIVVTNAGTGPALKVTQTGAEAIAEFYDDGGVLALKVADGGNVGIGTASPLQALHVQGAVQAHTQFLGQASDTVAAPSFSWAGDTNTGLYLPATDQIGVVTAGAERMRVAANGNVGIGTTTPNYKLDVNGTIYASGDVIMFSDARKKTNVEVIPSALEKVLRIRGVTFEKLDTEETQRRHVGVIAQEVEEVLPEVVYTAADGTKSVAYGNMIGLLIEAVRELAGRL